MLIGPVRPVFVPPRGSVPLPLLVRPAVETRTELMVKFVKLFWWTISSPALGAVMVPPLIVPPVAFAVTRMPPDWRVFVPDRVNVWLPVLNRRELVVMAAALAG